MSIKKDEVLEKERAAKEKKSLAAILDKIKNKKAIRVFTNSDIRDNFDKNQAVKKQYGKYKHYKFLSFRLVREEQKLPQKVMSSTLENKYNQVLSIAVSC